MQYLVGVLFKSYIKCFSKIVQGRKQDLDSLDFANEKVCVLPGACDFQTYVLTEFQKKKKKAYLLSNSSMTSLGASLPIFMNCSQVRTPSSSGSPL